MNEGQRGIQKKNTRQKKWEAEKKNDKIKRKTVCVRITGQGNKKCEI